MKPAVHENGAEEQQDSESSHQGKPRQSQAPESGRRAQPPGVFPFHPETEPSLLPEAHTQNEPSHSPLIPTIFHEDWWLDAATGGSYSAVEVESGGKAVGRLPFVVRKRFGVTGIWTPPLTHFLGPGIDEGEGGSNSRFLHRLEITRELILKLPRSSWQCVRCHRGTTDVIAFQEESFKTYAQFTHEIAPAPITDLWQQMRSKTRNVIRRAQERFAVRELYDVEQFIRVYASHLASRHIENTLDLSAARRVLTVALERNRGRILAAIDDRDEIAAANFCAWDGTASFYIACTRSENAGNGATSQLVWEAIQDAAGRGLIFDFSGMGTRGSVLHYAGFGGSVATRFVAVRATGIGRLVARARLLLMDEHYLF
jgi:hypothetical protein